MRKFYKILFLFVLVIFNTSLAHSSTNFGVNEPTKTIASPSGQITGNATVCLNSTPLPLIKFEVIDDNGKDPYTFTYTINGGSPINATTTGNNKSLTVSQPTNAANTFIYILTGVKDKDNNTVPVSSSNTVTINVIPNYTVSAGNDILVCKGNTINLNASPTGNGSNAVSYSWTGPSGFTSNQQSPSIPNSTTAMSGIYTVTANIGNCKVQDVVNVQVINVGITNPSTLNACLSQNQTSAQVGLMLTLPTNASLIQSITVIWGDNLTPQVIPQSDWAIPITHIYPVGSYTVTITATTSLGCNTVQTYAAFIGSSPQAATLSLFANQASGCSPHTTNFTFGIPISNSDGTNYLICFGDNSSSCINYIDGKTIPSDWVFSGTAAGFNLYTITHEYNIISCGNSVNLNGTTYNNVFLPSVITTNPCTAPQPQAGSLISVGLPPSASFTPNPIPNACINVPITLNNNSNFGGTIDPITYSCTSTSPFYWTITPSGAGLWTASGLGSNNNYPDNELYWTPGSMTPSITFKQPGNYTITLFVKNSCGLSSVSHTICIEPPLIPLFTVDSSSGCIPLQVKTNNSTNPINPCSPPIYAWSVSYAAANCGTTSAYSYTNGTSATSISPSFSFSEAGTYTITLMATNSCTPAQTTTQIVTVKKPPTINSINGMLANYCGPTSINPTATVNSCAPASSTLFYEWSFPGGSPATSTSAIPGPISYATAGNYTVSLIIRNECGSSATTTKSFTINDTPVLTNSPLNQTICSGSSTSLVNLTSSPAGATFSWNATATAGVSGLTPSGTNTIPVQIIKTTNPSPGTVTYAIMPTLGGCPGTTTYYVITVNPAPVITSQPASSTVCQGGTPTVLSFAVSGATGTPTYQWYSNVTNNTKSGTAVPGATNATFAPPSTTAGTLYYYCIVTLPAGGCSNITTTTATVSILPNATITSQPIATQSLCVGASIPTPLTISFTGGTGTVSYQWYFNTTNLNTGGSSIAGATLSNYTPPAYTVPGNYYYYATVTLNGNGCLPATSNVAEIIVYADPTISSQPTASQTLCQGATPLSLDVTATGGNGTFSYQWYSNPNNSYTGSTLLTGAINSTYIPPTNTVGTKYYYCIVNQNSTSGCSVSSATAAIVVISAPTNTTPLVSSTVCQGGTLSPLSITVSGATGTPTYQWYSSTVNDTSSGTPISGAISATYIPLSSIVGTTYYYCIITLPSGGCSNITSNMATITINPGATISTQPTVTQSLCVGATIATPLTISYTGGTGTPTYQWYYNTSSLNTGGALILGATNASYTPPVFTATGNYYYYAVVTLSGNGCGPVASNIAEVVIVADPTVTSQPLPSQTVCQTAAPSNLVVSVSGGISAAYSYQWYSNISNNNTTGTAISLATNDTYLPPTAIVGTTYYYCVITQTSGSGCNVSSAAAAVVVTLAPTFTSQPISSTVCLGGTPTVLSVAYANGVGTPAYQWFSNTTNSTSGATAISGETNATFSPPNSPVGTIYYYCVISLPPTGGCSSITSDIAFVTINAGATIDSQPTVTQSLCVGATLSTPLSITYSGGTGTATYQWYSNSSSVNSGGTLISGATNASYTPSVFTTTGIFHYYAVVTLSGNGCGPITSNAAEIVIVADPVVSSQPLASQTICQNVVPTSLSVAVSGGISAAYSYQWYSNASNNNSSGTPISGALTDTYIPPTSDVGTLYYYCVVSQTNGSGCAVSSNTAAIVVNLAPTFTSQPASSTICMGQIPTLLSVSYMNGVGTATYQWYSNGVSSISGSSPIAGATNTTYAPPNSIAGTVYYYCVITLPATGGCSDLTSTIATVSVNQNPIISNKNSLICSDNTFSITPNTSGGDIVPMGTTYTWNNPTILPAGSITGASAQSTPQTGISQTLINTTTSPAIVSYTVSPLSGVCIGANFIVAVTVNPAISPNVTSTNSSCFGANSGTIQTNITGGIPFSSGAPYQISWSGPNGFASPASNLSNLAPGNYNLSITDAGGCPINETYLVTEPADIVLTTVLEKDVTCFNDANAAIDITISGGTLNYTFAWTKNGTAFANTEDISNLSPGIYVVTVSDANNCGPKTASFTITEPPILAVNLVNKTDILCFGDATGTITVNIVGGTLPYTYAWSGPNSFTNSNPNLTAVLAGTYNLIVSDNSGCTKNISVQLTQTPEIKITATTTPIICYGANNASISIAISGGVGPYAVLWSNMGSGTFQDNLSAGDYLITVTDALNCIQTLSVNIPEAPVFTINPVVQNISCFGDKNGSINLNIVGGIAPVQLVWDDSAVAGNVRNNLGPGSYTVTITDGKPCSIKRTFIILEPQLLVLRGNITNAIDCTDANSGAINLLVSGGSPPFVYSWSNGATTEDLVNIPAGNYLVTVKDANGCSQQAQYGISQPPPIVTSVVTKTDFNCDTKMVKQTFVAHVSGGVPPYQLVWSSGAISGPNNEFMNTSQNGTVILNATDAIGCQSSYTFIVDIPTLGTPSQNSSSYAYLTYGTFSINDPIQFTNTATGDYISMIWDFGDGSVSTDLNPVHTFLNPKEYVVTQTVTYPFGCVYVQKITFTVGKGYILVVPTAFTPNNDSLNDTFRPVTKGLKKVRLDIYDTWGSMIYSESGDLIKGWNGKIKGHNAENGNYYCKVSGETFYGIIINENTPFVLIK